MSLAKFDESKVRWYTLDGIDDVWLNVLEVDEKNGIVDILYKFSANKQIVLHRHKAPYRTFVIQGELRIYKANGDLKEIRPTGSYVSKPASDEPHREGGGDQDVIAIFSNRDVDDVVYEVLDDNLNALPRLVSRNSGSFLRPIHAET
jgi:2,4'-dihydroxyacetophenone dioxygenase